VQAPVADAERHSLELPDWPDGVDVPEHEQLSRACPELRAEVIASGLVRNDRHDGAQIGETAGELRTASIHGDLVGGGRFQPHERVDQLHQPGKVFLAGGLDGCKAHRSDPSRQ
jgi:hypothetical protein